MHGKLEGLIHQEVYRDNDESFMSNRSGASYAPEGGCVPVVAPGEFKFSAAFLDHGHIYGQTKGLLEAGGTLCSVYDPDQSKLDAFCKKYPQVKAVRAFDEILDDESLHLVASAAIPDVRARIGAEVIESGKDYFTDKAPFTTLDQLERMRTLTRATGRKYLVYYAERVHNEAAWHAGELINEGAVGEVIQVLNLAPHRLSAKYRPDWFFQKQHYGGIITDIGSHQVEQFLTYASAKDATVNFALAKNVSHAAYPELEDFGEFSLTGDNGTSFYSRVDWFTPDGMPVWGDGRTFIVGTNGSMEVRKYIDPQRSSPASLIHLTTQDETREIDCLGVIGYPFFGQLILDVLNRTENSMGQEHIFKASELSLLAQEMADAHGGAF